MPISCHKNFCLVVIAFLLNMGSLPAQAKLPISSTLAQSSAQKQLNPLQERSENLVNLLAEEKFDQVLDQLSPELKLLWTADKLKEVWEKLLLTTGPYQKDLKSVYAQTLNADLVSVTAKFEKTTGDFLVTFNKNQEVIGIDFPKVETIQVISEEFIEALVTEDFAKARGYLHPFLKIEIFPQQVQEKWERVLAKTGAVKKQLPPEVKTGLSSADADLVLVPIEFENETGYMVLIFDQYKRIIGVDFPTGESTQ